jgi:hypothetical protein
MDFDTANFSWLVAISVFFAYFVIDILYATYTLSVTERKAGRAAMISAIMYTALAFGVLSYTENAFYLIPLMIGAFSGTYIAVAWPKLISFFKNK